MGAQAVRLSNIDIDNALKNKEFEVIFQPIFDLGNGALARVEAFVRWRHPSLGVLPPGAFISFFESQGRMSELTRYVLNQALTRYLDWRGPSAPGFSVNLALSDLSDEAFASHFSVLLRDRGFPADLITLECPMPPVTMPIEAAAEHFSRLASSGARLAIEVRGRANDFLRSIDPFPFDEIKTGGAAILRFARTVRGPGLSAISELIEIANNANAAITAVGVEDQASLAALRSLGFAAAQGNHLGRVGSLSGFLPSRVNEVRELLGLEQLSEEDLHSLFRTEAPAPQQPESDQATTAADVSAEQEALVERLEARLARHREEADNDSEFDRQSQSRKPKLAAAKAAAIARAKRKAAQRATAETGEPDIEPSQTAPLASEQGAESAAARHLQERLAEEFGAPAQAEEDQQTAMTDPKDSSPDDDCDVEFAEQTDEPEAAEDSVEDAAFEFDGETAERNEIEEEQANMEEVAEKVAAAGGGLVRASLAVGRTGAYFRPGMRIGALAPAPAPERRLSTVEGDPEEEPPTAAEPAASEELEAPEAGDNGEHADEETQTIPASAPARPRRRRRKNFLTRKYHISWPTHFWPRSLKRMWRRRRAMSPQAESGEDLIAAE